MSSPTSHTPSILQLAESLEQDIREKRLRPGDPYLNTLQAARLLRVSTMSANRALQLLAKREVLLRRQRSGTFIAEPPSKEAAKLDRIHMLVHRHCLKTEGILADGVVLGLQGKLPQAQIQFNFLPADNEESYANLIVSEALRSKRVEGFVLVRAPLSVQRIVQASGLPSVIHGTPFPSITRIPSIDRDHYQTGRLAAMRMLRRGFRDITVLTRDRMWPGDYSMLDGVRDAMIAARLALKSLRWRPLPHDVEVVRHHVLDLLRSSNTKQAFICRSRPLAEGALEAIGKRRFKLDRDVGIVVQDVYHSASHQLPRCAYLLPTMDPETIGQRIGHMLSLQSLGQPLDPYQEFIPVELREAN